MRNYISSVEERGMEWYLSTVADPRIGNIQVFCFFWMIHRRASIRREGGSVGSSSGADGRKGQHTPTLDYVPLVVEKHLSGEKLKLGFPAHGGTLILVPQDHHSIAPALRLPQGCI